MHASASVSEDLVTLTARAAASYFDVVDVDGEVVTRRRDGVVEADLTKVKRLIAIKYEISHILFKVCDKNSSVVVIGYTSSIHRFANKVPESTPRNRPIGGERLVEVHGYQSSRDVQVCFIKVVRNIPSDFPILASFLR